MELIRIQNNDQREFAAASEIAMDFQFGRSHGGEFYYLVVGCRVGIPLNESTFAQPDRGYLMQPWLNSRVSAEDRSVAFEGWFSALEATTAALAPATLAQAWPSFLGAMSVTPIGTLPAPPPPPTSIYGHLPFATTTLPETIIYRWEAFPTSKRIDRSLNPPTIAQGTYAAPALEAPFALTGFAAVARFALPNLMPACFRYELQPIDGTPLECGASVPLYGQSGGGVEVKFTTRTNNRGPIADPIILPSL